MSYLLITILGCTPVKTEPSAQPLSEPSTVDEPEVDAPEPSEDSVSEPDNTPEEQDPFAQTDQLACADHSVRDQLQPLLFPVSESDAAQILINPALLDSQGELAGEQHVIEFSGAEAWFVMQVPSWMCVVSLYTEQAAEIEIFPTDDVDFLGESAFDVLSDQVENEQCEGELLRNSWQFHAWGSYLVRITPEDPNNAFWFSTYLLD